jgi:Tryptophan-associated transmembrane protein (Trp_oprn_chp)
VSGQSTAVSGQPVGGATTITPRRARRELVVALLLCLAGAALALYAARRTWAVDLTPRPAPLPVLRTARAGGDLVPWVPALAVVGLAGAGAVLATRGRARRLVGLLLVLVGLGVAAGGAFGVLGAPRGPVGPTAPLLCVIGGLVATAGGTLTAARGHCWPGLGARYESPHRPDTPAGETTRGGADGRSTSAAWDALDRGEDPTVR